MLWDQIRKQQRWTSIMVLLCRSICLLGLQNPWWNGWKASKENRKLKSSWTSIWSWMRCFYSRIRSTNISKMLLGWRQYVLSFHNLDCLLCIPYFNFGRVLHWRSIPWTWKRCYRWLSGYSCFAYHDGILRQWLVGQAML